MRRIYHVVVDESLATVAQDIHTLKPVNAPSGPPMYPATNLGPGCDRCTVTDLSSEAVFNVGGTHITQKIVWRAANGDTLSGNFVGRYVQLSTTSLFTVGHKNQFVGTITIVNGTGAFAGARGTLSSTDTTTVTDVDRNTGIAHKNDVNVTRGTLTYPPT